MDKPCINIVWLKRDLRTQDHAPLASAEASGLPYLIIYIVEPCWLERADYSPRHWQFICGSIDVMDSHLERFGLQVERLFGDAERVFSALCERYRVQSVFSYQESGVLETWRSDIAVANCLKERGIQWQEFQSNGVLRGITDRKGWDRRWYATIDTPPINNAYRRHSPFFLEHDFGLPDNMRQASQAYPEDRQPPGQDKGWLYLTSFAENRSSHYMQNISKPGASRASGGRLSPYLAWGNLSSRQAYRYVRSHPNYPQQRKNFDAFTTRLKWRCHFIQKFEVESEYETQCINRGYELLPHRHETSAVERWESGTTGFPLVDACIRCVVQTGWLNFRMRAMLVSFLCHHLDQDWRRGVHFLARQFVDYEPGIHYPQFQMQASTTGINTVRIYNPVKQSIEHDPEGLFIKRWLPELEQVPTPYIHQPWLMPPFEQVFCEFQLGIDYPLPIVDIHVSGAQARDKLWGHRRHPLVSREKKRLLKTHTRNR
ncbi:MAG TPA: deoxyribodipyrimidine photolyase [Porticoccaceae bacterium]|nr:deoxyribodipyrimidine photolyase [Porticoccaceae bacterium]